MMLLLTVCILLVGVGVSPANVVIPNTPAGKTAASWIEAINSTDQTRLDEYYKKYDPSHSPHDIVGIRDLTGGFDLVSIESSEPLRIVYILKERNGADLALAKIDVTNTNPPQVTYSSLYISPCATIMGFNIDAATRARVQ